MVKNDLMIQLPTVDLRIETNGDLGISRLSLESHILQNDFWMWGNGELLQLKRKFQVKLEIRLRHLLSWPGWKCMNPWRQETLETAM